jgi:outer membrane protein OmpA-like peptidoglycan-associated protein
MNPEPVAKPTDAKPVDVVPPTPEKPVVKPTNDQDNNESVEPAPSTKPASGKKPAVKQAKKVPAKTAVQKKKTVQRPAGKKPASAKKRAPSNISPELRKKLADVVTPDEHLGDDPYKGTSKALTPKQIKLMKEQPRFGLSGFDIDDVAAAQLNEIAEILKARPKMKLEIGGFGCDKGGPEVTRQTSIGRSESVRRYLASKGVPAEQLETKEYGVDKPIRKNDDEDGKAANRRVQFKFLP